MARTTFDSAIVSIEKVQFNDVHLLKLFVGDEPDGERDGVSSLLSMRVHEDVLDEVWNVCKGLSLGDPIRVTAEIDRGKDNAGKFIVLHVEPITAAQASKPATPAGQQQVKPADPAKS